MTEKIKIEKRKKKGEVKILEIGEERRRKKEELTKKKGAVAKERRKRKREKKESDKGRERRKKVKKEERGNELKKNSIFICTVPKMERYCSCVLKIITFGTSHKRGFLVFGVPNAKYLAFGTPDGMHS